MKYERFEDLPVWKTGIELGLVACGPAALGWESNTAEGGGATHGNQPGDLTDQLRRASLSVSNNIAEGFERGSTAELIMFLYIARGSAGETRSALRFTDRLPGAEHLKSQISNCISLAESCSRQLRGWLDELQNTDIKGQRHLNEQSQRIYDDKQRAEAFQRQLDEIMRKARPQDYPSD